MRYYLAKDRGNAAGFIVFMIGFFGVSVAADSLADFVGLEPSLWLAMAIALIAITITFPLLRRALNLRDW
jgi:hypothetical protein